MGARTELDKINFSYVRFNPLTYDQIETSEIYLAKPGHRIIGRINGIDESGCQLSMQLNNTSTIEFTVYRIIDGELSTFYDLIDRHYELYVTHFGWFKINEEPEINNDGNVETKSVRAESNEIELQQFDKVNFEINTGSVSSAEMMATDNTYEIGEYKLPRDNVKFWRDTSQLEALIKVFPQNGTAQQLISMMPQYPCLRDCWRIEFDLDNYDDALRAAIQDYQNQGYNTEYLEKMVGQVKDQLSAWQLAKGYPYIFDHISIVDIDVKNYDYVEPVEDGESEQEPETDESNKPEYTVYEVLQLELQREKELSFLDLVLEETGWSVGYIDPTYNASSEDEGEREILADKVGKFQVDTQDVYSFLTQEATQYYRCIFDFDTENYKVNAYKIESLGVDTNIFLSFHNIQNSVTRSSDRELHTVYSVANGTGDDRLDIREGNIGNIEIEDLSYFMNTKHFPQEMIDKYNAWLELREQKRQEYMELCIQWRDETDKLNDIFGRVPVDGTNTAQYASMTVEQLEAEIENYKAQLRGIEALHVDDNNEFDEDDLRESDDWATYQMIKYVILSDPQDTLMVVEPSAEWDALTAKLDADQKDQSDNQEVIDGLVDERAELIQQLTDLQNEQTSLTAELEELEEIDNPTAEQTARIAEINERLTALPSEISAKQAEITAKNSEISDAESTDTSISSTIDDDVAAIREYYNNHKYDGIIDDDTIKDVSMYYIKTDDFHLGHIDTELFNRWQIQHYTTDQGESGLKKIEFDEDYIYDLEKYGDAYGLDELKKLLKTLYNKVYTEGQYANVDVSTADTFHKQHKALYDKYKAAYDKCQEVIEERQAEFDTQQTVVDNIMLQRDEITDAVNNYSWTDAEKWLLQRYRIHTDYVNENIVITDISTNRQIVEQSYNLYKDAIEELYADSHPQWNFSTTQDNLLLMPELQDWHGQLELGNFIRIGFREDDPDYVISSSQDNQVKLRLIGITLNPFMSETTIDLQFSNMVQYKSKRNDFVSILGSGGGSGKNQISASYAATAGTAETVNVTTDLIMKLVNNPSFGSGAGNAIVSGGYISDALNTMTISVDQIGDLKTRLTDLVKGYVDANVITTKILNADEATINTLKTQLIDTDTVVARLLEATQIQTDALSAKVITTDSIVAGLVNAQSGDFDDLTANTAFIQYLNSGVIETGVVTADNIIAGLASVTQQQMDKFNVLADSAFINYLETNMIVASEIQVDDLKAKLAQVDTLNAQSAFVNYLQGLSSSVATSVIDDAYIANAVVGKITAGQLAAGDITLSNSMRIVSDNGQMVMNGTALQIMGEDGNGDPYVGIQLGYDTNQNPSLILRNEDGATILTPQGITSDAIADGLIVNNMIGNNTIQKSKLGFQVIEPNAQGGIDITQIYDGEGGLWGEEYTSFKQGTQQALQDLAQDIEDSANFDLYIEAPNGTNIWGGNIQLNVKLLKNNVDVTDDYDASCFIWTRTSRDHDADLYWNSNHSQGEKVVTITANDVRMNANFQCKFEYNDVTVVAG